MVAEVEPVGVTVVVKRVVVQTVGAMKSLTAAAVVERVVAISLELGRAAPVGEATTAVRRARAAVEEAVAVAQEMGVSVVVAPVVAARVVVAIMTIAEEVVMVAEWVVVWMAVPGTAAAEGEVAGMAMELAATGREVVMVRAKVAALDMQSA